MEIYVRLNEILEKMNMTQKQLADITELRPATISEICNNQRSALNKQHLVKIMQALDIDDISDLIIIKNN